MTDYTTCRLINSFFSTKLIEICYCKDQKALECLLKYMLYDPNSTLTLVNSRYSSLIPLVRRDCHDKKSSGFDSRREINRLGFVLIEF